MNRDFWGDNRYVGITGSGRNHYYLDNRNVTPTAASNRDFHRETSNMHVNRSSFRSYLRSGQKYYDPDLRTGNNNTSDKLCEKYYLGRCDTFD